ncbi:MAG: hypothetical protein KJ630_07105 [Proteobacteria bacterium]|nr:hypothetical protein [Pseudomonadota bacterium]
MATVARTYLYTFSLPNQRNIDFTVTLDPISQQVNICPLVAPSWAKLEYHQCSPCPLQCTEHPFCPAALCIADLVDIFKDTASYVKCRVTCISPERTVIKETIVQEGLASILGLLMATSGCPIMNFFKPMARFHLPFSSVDESIFRIVAVYMIRQYYRKDDAKDDQFSLHDIKNHYTLVKQVNKGILERILSATDLDADKNAIVTLSSLGQILEMEIDANLESLHHLFLET